MEWNELTRAEKIAHLFDYPYPQRLEMVHELWGENASEYAEIVHFPPMTPCEEIVTVIKLTGKTQYAYVSLCDDDFGVITNDDIEKNCDEALALIRWYKKVMSSKQPVKLDFSLYDEKTLIGKACTEEGYRGDSDGFGVEPDMWANALFDFEMKVIAPFRPGYNRHND